METKDTKNLLNLLLFLKGIINARNEIKDIKRDLSQLLEKIK